MPPTRRPTSTSNFGAGRRESHDATGFYERFTAPTISEDEQVNPCSAGGGIIVGASRDMGAVEAGWGGLVVPSPPYFAGKQYEEALGDGHIPASYLEYLTM